MFVRTSSSKGIKKEQQGQMHSAMRSIFSHYAIARDDRLSWNKVQPFLMSN